MLTRSCWTALALLLVSGSGPAGAADGPAKQPNVVIILADDKEQIASEGQLAARKTKGKQLIPPLLLGRLVVGNCGQVRVINYFLLQKRPGSWLSSPRQRPSPVRRAHPPAAAQKPRLPSGSHPTCNASPR
jgi:hypothetical protein